MKKSLTLKTERLASLSEEELRLAAGAGGVDETYTGRIDCVLSIGGARCVTSLCSYVDCVTTILQS